MGLKALSANEVDLSCDVSLLHTLKLMPEAVITLPSAAVRPACPLCPCMLSEMLTFPDVCLWRGEQNGLSNTINGAVWPQACSVIP